jgi:hypothetical protein
MLWVVQDEEHHRWKNQPLNIKTNITYIYIYIIKYPDRIFTHIYYAAYCKNQACVGSCYYYMYHLFNTSVNDMRKLQLKRRNNFTLHSSTQSHHFSINKLYVN